MTKTTSVLSHSVSELAAMLQSRKLSALELVNLTYEQLSKANKALNAVTIFNIDQAREHAKHYDALLAKGQCLGPLHGVPITIKDSINVADLPTSEGVKAFADYIPEHEATAISRLRAAGAIVVAKTNVPEFVFAGETDNLLHGRTNNPYDLSRTPGGSSGGEAAVIASAAVPAGVGSDMLGSLRIPAHYCGVATLRPTVGRIPSSFLSNDHPLGFSIGLKGFVNTIGPMAKYVADLELLTNIMSGPDGIDPYTVPSQAIHSDAVDVHALKYGYFVEDDLFAADADTKALFSKLLTGLKDEKVEPAHHPLHFKPDIMSVFKTAMKGYEVDLALMKKIADSGMSEISTHLQLALKFMATQQDYKQSPAMTVVTLDIYRSLFLQALADIDVLLCPVLPFAALPHERCLWEPQLTNAASYLAYMTFGPSTTAVVRIGESADGLPMGVQIVAKPWEEAKVLAVAKHLERMFGGWQAPV